MYIYMHTYIHIYIRIGPQLRAYTQIRNTRVCILKVPWSYYVSAISKFALLMYMREFRWYVLLKF